MKKILLFTLLISNFTVIAQTVLTYYSPFSLTMPADSTLQTSALVIKEHDSKVYVGTDDGLNIYFHGVWQKISTVAIGCPNIKDIAFDNQGNIWMTTDYAVVRMDSNYNITQYTTSNSGMPYYDIQSIAVDNAGNIWVTGSPVPLYNSGVTKFDGTNWTSYDSTNSPIANDWYTIMADNSGNIWLNGIQTSNLIRFDGTNWTIFQDTDYNIPGGLVSSMACDDAGFVWINVFAGDENLVRYDGHNFTTVSSNNIIGSDPANQIVIDELGNKWLAISGMWLNKFDGVQMTRYFDTTATFNGFRTIGAVGRNVWIGPYSNNYNQINVLAEHGFNKISGNVYFDSNSDGIRQTNEPDLPNVLLHLMPEDRYVFSQTTGYDIPLIDTSGNYTVELVQPSHWHTINAIRNVSQTFEGEITDSIDFDLNCDTTVTDVSISMTSTIMIPGFYSQLWLNIQNKSTQTLSDTITLLLDTQLTFNSSVPAADYHSNDTLQWYYSYLLPMETRTYRVSCSVSVNSALGDTISLYSQILPLSGDTFPADNADTIFTAVVGSFDPNSKEVSPKGTGPNSAILPGQELEYVINFQNTGTYQAFTVMIRDTLSTDLDLSTLAITGFSHPVTYQLYDRCLVFTFSNIMLPDSNSDEQNSHGFVKYKIKPNANVINGSVINNYALIFFDYNQPVITNSVSNTIDFYLSTNERNADNQIRIYPNPATNVINFQANEIHTVQVFNMQGQLIDVLHINRNEFSIDIRNYNPGIYLIKAVDKSEVIISRFIKQ